MTIMRVIVAPQSFKGTLSALEASHAIRGGILHAWPTASVEPIPVADGGDGTLEVLLKGQSDTLHKATVTGPLDSPIETYWGVLPKSQTAIIEMAKVCGLGLVPVSRRNPAFTTTFGLGELIRQILDLGYRKFIVGIGGSSTNDAGAGMLQALGIRLLDANGADIPRGGAALKYLDHLDLSSIDPRIQESHIRVACDVINPLYGPTGATQIFAPQKGASPEMVSELEIGLQTFAKVIKRDIGTDVENIPGGGAAGGTGAAFMALMGAELRAGSELILKEINFRTSLENADLVITGEGCMDGQTRYHKAPYAVAKAAKEFSLPVLALVGSLGEGYETVHEFGIDSVIPLTFLPAKNPQNTYTLLEKAAEEAIRCFQMRIPKHFLANQ
jgi:glycerate 2-kinase